MSRFVVCRGDASRRPFFYRRVPRRVIQHSPRAKNVVLSKVEGGADLMLRVRKYAPVFYRRILRRVIQRSPRAKNVVLSKVEGGGTVVVTTRCIAREKPLSRILRSQNSAPAAGEEAGTCTDFAEQNSVRVPGSPSVAKTRASVRFSKNV